MYGSLLLALPAFIVSTLLPVETKYGAETAVACAGLVSRLPITTVFPAVSTYHLMSYCCAIWLLAAALADARACSLCIGCSRRAQTWAALFTLRATAHGAVLSLFLAGALLAHVHYDAALSTLALSEWTRVQAALNVNTPWVYFPLASPMCDGKLPVAVMSSDMHMPPVTCGATCSALLANTTLCCLPWTATATAHAAYVVHVLRSRASVALFALIIACQVNIAVWLIVGCAHRQRRANARAAFAENEALAPLLVAPFTQATSLQ
jgi:hypothetical protein